MENAVTKDRHMGSSNYIVTLYSIVRGVPISSVSVEHFYSSSFYPSLLLLSPTSFFFDLSFSICHISKLKVIKVKYKGREKEKEIIFF